jgi:hypothetical protein
VGGSSSSKKRMPHGPGTKVLTTKLGDRVERREFRSQIERGETCKVLLLLST